MTYRNFAVKTGLSVLIAFTLTITAHASTVPCEEQIFGPFTDKSGGCGLAHCSNDREVHRLHEEAVQFCIAERKRAEAKCVAKRYKLRHEYPNDPNFFMNCYFQGGAK